MSTIEINQFHTVDDLQKNLHSNLESLNNKINDYSQLIGDKIRVEEKSDTKEFEELKAKLETDTKDTKSENTKKKNIKKGTNQDWINYNGLSIFNGIGTKGELEIYFKALEELKLKAEKLKNTQESIDKLMSSGIKKDLGCISLDKENGPMEIAFIKTDSKSEKFAYKSIISIGCEEAI